jgi:hypothetical protein
MFCILSFLGCVLFFYWLFCFRACFRSFSGVILGFFSSVFVSFSAVFSFGFGLFSGAVFTPPAPLKSLFSKGWEKREKRAEKGVQIASNQRDKRKTQIVDNFFGKRQFLGKFNINQVQIAQKSGKNRTENSKKESGNGTKKREKSIFLRQRCDFCPPLLLPAAFGGSSLFWRLCLPPPEKMPRERQKTKSPLKSGLLSFNLRYSQDVLSA